MRKRTTLEQRLDSVITQGEPVRSARRSSASEVKLPPVSTPPPRAKHKAVGLNPAAGEASEPRKCRTSLRTSCSDSLSVRHPGHAAPGSHSKGSRPDTNASRAEGRSRPDSQLSAPSHRVQTPEWSMAIPRRDGRDVLDLPEVWEDSPTSAEGEKSKLPDIREKLTRAKAQLEQEAKARLREQVRDIRERAAAAMEDEDWVTYEQLLGEALKLESTNATLLATRSMVNLKLDRPDRALRDAERAIRISPGSTQAHYRRARALCREQRFNEAAADLLTSMKSAPLTWSQAESRYNDVLGRVRRDRAYLQLPSASHDVKRRSRMPRWREPAMLPRTPPRTSKPPGVCASLGLGDVPEGQVDRSRCAHLTWTEPRDNGGEPIWKYELQMAAVDKVFAATTPVFKTCYEGVPACKPFAVTVEKLLPESDYLFRVAAHNYVGPGEWTDPLVVTTDSRAEVERAAKRELPPQWVALETRIDDLLSDAYGGVTYACHWEGLVKSMRRHATSLKIAFRLYAFMGAHNDAVDSMGEAQFRSFVEDTQIQTYVSDHQCDLIYRRVKYNEDEAELAITLAKSPRAHLAEHEFVHAVIRLARARFPSILIGSEDDDESPSPLGNCFDELMEQHVVPFATFKMRDSITLSLKSAAVRHIFLKFRDDLSTLYNLYASTDGNGQLVLHLHSVLAMLSDMKMFDEKCSPRDATVFFVRLRTDLWQDHQTVDRETLGIARSKRKSTNSLAFDGFCEIIARVCNERVPHAMDHFADSLDHWLTLYFIPAARIAISLKRIQTSPQNVD